MAEYDDIIHFRKAGLQRLKDEKSEMTTTNVIDFDILAPRVEQVLRKLVGTNAAIELTPGYQGRVRAKVITPFLNGMTEREKQQILWEVLRAELNGDSDSISFIVAYSMDEL